MLSDSDEIMNVLPIKLDAYSDVLTNGENDNKTFATIQCTYKIEIIGVLI